MLNFEEYSKIQELHYTGLKTLHQKVTYPNISISKQPKGYLKPTANTFSAYYNKKGKLIHVIKRLKQTPYKYHYFYDWDNRLIKALEIQQKSNRLVGENIIKYTEDDFFIEYLQEAIGSIAERTSEIHHSIEHDIEIVERKACPKDDWYLQQTLRYDNIREELFDTNLEWQDVTIFELNNNKRVVKEYYESLEYDEDGLLEESENKFNPTDYYLYEYYGSGLVKSMVYVSKEPWTKTYQYKFNERGHWIEKITLRNGELQYLTERKLLYF